MKLNEILEYELKKDTRDQSDLHVYNMKEKLSKEQYIELNQNLKEHNCYYSKFVKGFICKAKLDLDNIETKEVEQKQPTTNVKYFKRLEDYITVEEYKDYLRKQAKENYQRSFNYRIGNYKTIEDLIETYTKELLDNVDFMIKNDYFGKLDYIREAILHKSLGFEKEELRVNGSSDYYVAIWDKLPVIKDLKLTDEAYTAMWGYDQTNVDIAYRLNKKVWGLDIFRNTDGSFYLVRMKDGRFHDSVRYFSRDKNPYETFKHDASQTGNYR